MAKHIDYMTLYVCTNPACLHKEWRAPSWRKDQVKKCQECRSPLKVDETKEEEPPPSNPPAA